MPNKSTNQRKRKLRILVSNDDGIYAPGIHALVKELKKIGEVYVFAPSSQQSAVGHAITVSEPLRAHRYSVGKKFFGYAVNGTPADAVKLGVTTLLKFRPDVLVSGINHGSNTAISVMYSGTVSAATEGTILGIPSMAISLTTYAEADFSFAAVIARKMVLKIVKFGLPRGVLLNVNVPALPKKKIKGLKITKQGTNTWDDWFDVRHDPGNRPYYWLTGELTRVNDNESDQAAIEKRYVSVTPIHYDLTHHGMLKELNHWKLDRITHQ